MLNVITYRTAIRLCIAVGIGVVVAACGGSGGSETASTADVVAEPTTTAPTLSPSTTVPPTPTSSTTTIPPVVAATIDIDGAEEVMFDWTTDRCDDTDIPDLPARAFRDASGQINFITAHTFNRRSVGPTLDSLVRECDPILKSQHNGDPAAHADNEWLAAVHTRDGVKIHGLVHNEYHGWEHGDCSSADLFKCWYNTITAVVSTDGGATFSHLDDAPNHLVASLPIQYQPDSAPVGFFSPSNVVEGPGGFYYVLAKVGAAETGNQTVCLLRTKNYEDPAAWRFWDGSGFGGVFVDPYPTEPADPSPHECPALAIDDIGAQMIESLTWNTYLEQWVLVGISADTIDGRETWGFYYSFSADLIDWTRRQLLMEVEFPWTVDDPGSDLSYLYPSLIDQNTASLSFETTGETAYLYYTRNNEGHASLDRDLIRIPVRFTLDG